MHRGRLCPVWATVLALWICACGNLIAFGEVAEQIIAAAVSQGKTIWMGLQKSAPTYVRGYAPNFVDISAGVAANEISPSEAKMHLQKAHRLSVMGTANAPEMLLSAVQSFIDTVFGIVKSSTNAALPVAVL